MTPARTTSIVLRITALAVAVTGPVVGLVLVGRADRANPAPSGLWAEITEGPGRAEALAIAQQQLVLLCLLSMAAVVVLLVVDLVVSALAERQERLDAERARVAAVAPSIYVPQHLAKAS